MNEQRRQVWTYPKRSLSLKFPILTQTEVDTLWDFFTQQKGSYEPFWYFWPLQGATSWPSYTGEYVGRGDGTTIIFDLPSKDTSVATTDSNLVWGDWTKIPLDFTNADFNTWTAGASAPPDDWADKDKGTGSRGHGSPCRNQNEYVA